jgi:hypothetical protein
MDTFTVVIFLIMIMVAINQGITWAAALLMLLFVVAVRHSGILVVALIGLALAFMFQAQQQLIMLVASVVILGIFMFMKGGRGPEMYSPGMLLGGR